MRRPILILLLLSDLLSPLAEAVVMYTGDTAPNNYSPPAGSSWWEYVGQRGGGSAVYIGCYRGKYWYLTAAHVGAGDVSIAGLTYHFDPSVDQQFNLTTSYDSTTAPADLVLFNTSSGPNLPNIEIAQQLFYQELVAMSGYGKERGDSLRYWDSSWQETTPETATYTGYYLSNSRSKAYAYNNIEDQNVYLLSSGYQTFVFLMRFDANEGDGQVTPGDSGGGAFVQRDGAWQLAGIFLAWGMQQGQPSDRVVIGNLTLTAFLPAYRDQIYTLIPEPQQTSLLIAATLIGIGLSKRCALWRIVRLAPWGHLINRTRNNPHSH